MHNRAAELPQPKTLKMRIFSPHFHYGFVTPSESAQPLRLRSRYARRNFFELREPITQVAAEPELQAEPGFSHDCQMPFTK